MNYGFLNGKLKVIGSNRNYEMGIGPGNRSICLPPGCAVVLPSNVNIKEVGAGGYQGVAVDTDGRVWTWGRSAEGQRGDSDAALINGIGFVGAVTAAQIRSNIRTRCGQ